MNAPTGLLTGQTVGRYKVGPLIGRGGMGEVYRADDLELQRPVALKVLPEDLTADADRLARFSHEARTASALNHPHLVSIYEVGDGRVEGRTVRFIAMELVQGANLRQVLAERRTSLTKSLEYLAQAGDALAAAHSAGIVHRDLKPENLMIADGGYAKVLDFGLAKLTANSLPVSIATDATQTVAGPGGTTPGMVLGTVGYMSPEQAQGLPVDHRTDIFSFGCILYETATGTRPFTGASTIDTLHKIIHDQPQPITSIAPASPSELNRIVRKCLAKSPDERYQSMRDIALDLRELRRELESGPVASVAPAPRAVRARRLGWVIGAAVLLLAGAAAYWFSTRRDAPPRADLTMDRLTRSGAVIDAVISPDGRYLAYVESDAGTQALYYRQMNAGRPLQLVTTTGGFWGIALSRDGTTIFYALKSPADPQGALFSVPVLGGTPRRILSGIDSAVTFSPDGSRLAYYRVETGGQGASSLVIAGGDGADPRALVTLSSPEFFVPSFFATPAWSPDGLHIATAIRDSKTRESRVAIVSVADGTRKLLPARFAQVMQAAWLPDASALILTARALGTYGSGNGGQIWLQPYPSGELRRITNDLQEYRTASLTADASALLTVAFDANSWLYLADATGRGARKLGNERSFGGGIGWNADGTRIFYMKVESNDLQLWSVAADGSDPQQVVAGIQSSGVAATPDGQWIVYGSIRDDADGIWRARPDGSSPQLLATIVTPDALTLSPDGRTVYFSSPQDGPLSTYKIPIEGGTPTLVARGLWRASVSPDGRLLAGVYRPDQAAPMGIGLIDAASGRLVRTTPNYAAPSGGPNFAWTPDGQKVIFTTTERMNLFAETVAGGDREKLTDYSEQWIVRFALSPDGKRMALSRGTALRDAILLRNFN
jgi:Tol biopolymer transport system component